MRPLRAARSRRRRGGRAGRTAGGGSRRCRDGNRGSGAGNRSRAGSRRGVGRAGAHAGAGVEASLALSARSTGPSGRPRPASASPTKRRSRFRRGRARVAQSRGTSCSSVRRERSPPRRGSGGCCPTTRGRHHLPPAHARPARLARGAHRASRRSAARDSSTARSRFDDDVAEALYSRDRPVRTYRGSQVTPLRNNYNGRTPGPEIPPGLAAARSPGWPPAARRRSTISDLLSRFRAPRAGDAALLRGGLERGRVVGRRALRRPAARVPAGAAAPAGRRCARP